MIEIAGSPKSHVEETINKVIDIITKNEKLKILKKEIAEAKQVDLPKEMNTPKNIEVYSTFTELELEIPNYDELIQFCFTFMPSSLEIIEPEKITIDQKELENSTNDLLGRLHEQAKVIMEYQAIKQQIEKAKQLRANPSSEKN